MQNSLIKSFGRTLGSSLSILFLASHSPVLSLAQTESTVSTKIDKLIVAPGEIRLSATGSTQRIVVQAIFSDNSTKDISEEATLVVRQPDVVDVKSNYLTAIASGETTVDIDWNGTTASVLVKVQLNDAHSRLSFRNDILPILTKAGCNTGKCHGSASGKDGFRLSLFGYDPAGDHFRLTRELPGRRLNLAEPEKSLLMTKSIGLVPHTGGKRIGVGSDSYKTLMRWIAEGAPEDGREARKPVRIEVVPKEIVLENRNDSQRLVVQAYFDDGSSRDVTPWSVFLSNNDATATVSDTGQITATGPGSGFVMARYDRFTEGASIIVWPEKTLRFPDIQPSNYVDELTFARWQQLHIVPSELCSDEVFLRRVYLDLIGLLPTPKDRQEFLADLDQSKREKLIDRLLERPEFQDMWVMKWAEMLQIRSANGVSPKGLRLYDSWLRDRIRSGMTIDRIIAEIIPATGGTFENPATTYYQTETTPQLLAENLAQSFLGTRIQCAQCHNHPFDRWTLDDYYGFAAFFSQVGYKQAKDPREITIYNAAQGAVAHPISNRDVLPKYLGGEHANFRAGDDYRVGLAEWLTSQKNQAFSNTLANVIWSHFFGIGIVEPVDDMRVSNPPTNRPLLDSLGRKLAECGYDIKPLVRDICNSRTYQLTSETNDTNRLDDRHFSHSRIRRLRAEVLLDCINQVTGTEERFQGLLPGSRAVHVPDGRTSNYFLTTFGRASRATACSCEVMTNPTLSQALHLLNGEATTGKIDEGALIETMLESGSTPIQIVRVIYERCLCRVPSTSEQRAIDAQFATSTDPETDLADLFWAILNSNEFIFNH